MTTPPSKTQKLYRDSLVALRDLLRQEMPQGRSLEAAQEVRIGLHADDESWQACGIYLMPDRDTVSDFETNAWEHQLQVKVICSSKIETWTRDASDDDPGTLRLMDLVGGVLDLIKTNRSLNAEAYMEISGGERGGDVDFLILQAGNGAFWYRAEVPVVIRVSTYT